MKNNPLLIKKNVISDSLLIRSFWDVDGDIQYQNRWPQDRLLPFAENSLVIVYTQDGQGVIRTRSQGEINVRGSSVIFLDPLDIIRYGCSDLVWKLYWIEVSTTPAFLQMLPYNEVLSVMNKMHYQIQFDELVENMQYKDSIHRSYCASILNKILHELAVEYVSTPMDSKKERVERLLDEMHLHIHENWSVKEMAQVLQCSEQYLRRLFAEKIGMSPKSYFMALKLDLAYSLLKKGHKVTEVAFKFGFTDPYHFSNAFKQRFQHAPSEVLPQSRSMAKNILLGD